MDRLVKQLALNHKTPFLTSIYGSSQRAKRQIESEKLAFEATILFKNKKNEIRPNICNGSYHELF